MVTETEPVVDHFIVAPQRRVGALGIVRNPDGQVLFVEKANPPEEHPVPFYLPGGCVNGNEPILEGLVRAGRYKLGVTLEPGRLLAVHHMYEKQHRTHLSREGLNLLFDCGVWEADPEYVLGEGVARAVWVEPDEMEDRLMTFTALRVRAALRALEGGPVEVLADY